VELFNPVVHGAPQLSSRVDPVEVSYRKAAPLVGMASLAVGPTWNNENPIGPARPVVPLAPAGGRT
jgi:hypothetical protein